MEKPSDIPAIPFNKIKIQILISNQIRKKLLTFFFFKVMVGLKYHKIYLAQYIKWLVSFDFCFNYPLLFLIKWFNCNLILFLYKPMLSQSSSSSSTRVQVKKKKNRKSLRVEKNSLNNCKLFILFVWSGGSFSTLTSKYLFIILVSIEFVVYFFFIN
jgi:hypothetical protein